jgi:hypothetical protein
LYILLVPFCMYCCTLYVLPVPFCMYCCKVYVLPVPLSAFTRIYTFASWSLHAIYSSGVCSTV